MSSRSGETANADASAAMGGQEPPAQTCQDVTVPPARGGLRRWMHLLGWVLGLGSLYFFFGHFFEWAAFRDSLSQADRGLLVLAAAVYILGILVRSARWTYMVRCRWPGLTWTQGLHAVLSSNMINFLFPVRLGELFKLIIARQTFSIPYSASTAASIIEKLTLFLIMIFLLSFTPQIGYRFPDWSARFFPFLLLLLAVSAGFLFCGVKALRTCLALAGTVLRGIGLRQERVDRLLSNRLTCFAEDTLRQCHVTAYSAVQFGAALVLGLAILSLDGLTNMLLLAAFGLDITFSQAVIAACFFNLLFLLPSPPIQMGTAEMYPVLIYSGGLKLPAAVVASTAIIWHMIAGGVIIALGVLSLYAIGLRLGSIMAMARSGQENA